MALVSIVIPTAATARIKAMVQRFGPMVVPTDLPAGKTPDQWTNAEAFAVLRSMVRRFVLDLMKQHEAAAAAETARVTAIANVDSAGLVT